MNGFEDTLPSFRYSQSRLIRTKIREDFPSDSAGIRIKRECHCVCVWSSSKTAKLLIKVQIKRSDLGGCYHLAMETFEVQELNCYLFISVFQMSLKVCAVNIKFKAVHQIGFETVLHPKILYQSSDTKHNRSLVIVVPVAPHIWIKSLTEFNYMFIVVVVIYLPIS